MNDDDGNDLEIESEDDCLDEDDALGNIRGVSVGGHKHRYKHSGHGGSMASGNVNVHAFVENYSQRTSRTNSHTLDDMKSNDIDDKEYTMNIEKSNLASNYTETATFIDPRGISYRYLSSSPASSVGGDNGQDRKSGHEQEIIDAVAGSTSPRDHDHDRDEMKQSVSTGHGEHHYYPPPQHKHNGHEYPYGHMHGPGSYSPEPSDAPRILLNSGGRSLKQSVTQHHNQQEDIMDLSDVNNNYGTLKRTSNSTNNNNDVSSGSITNRRRNLRINGNKNGNITIDNNMLDLETPLSLAMSTPTTHTYVYHANAPRLIDIDNDPYGCTLDDGGESMMVDAVNNAQKNLSKTAKKSSIKM